MLIKTHRIALVTNNRQASLLARHAGFARFAYNSALADFKAGLDQGEWRRDRVLQRRFNAVKKELAPRSVDLCQNAGKYAIVDLGQAIDAFAHTGGRSRPGRRSEESGSPGSTDAVFVAVAGLAHGEGSVLRQAQDDGWGRRTRRTGRTRR